MDPLELEAWVNGEFRPVVEARVPVFDVGVFMGTSLAEALRTFGWKPFRLAQHLDRQERSARAVGMKLPTSREQMEKIVFGVVERARKSLPQGADVLINFYASPGPMGAAREPGGGGPTLIVWPVPINFALLGRQLAEGVALAIPATQQLPAACVPPRVKHRNRLHFTLAAREARKIDPEAMPVLLDAQGRLTECPAANLFLVKDGRLATPTTAVCLAGESRAFVLEMAHELGIPAEERDLQPYDLEFADEAFITATSRCCTPAVRINTRPIGSGEPGPMVARLLDAWSERVGLDVRAQMMQEEPT